MKYFNQFGKQIDTKKNEQLTMNIVLLLSDPNCSS